MFKKFIRNTKKYANFLYLGILIYVAIITMFTAFYIDRYEVPVAYDINNRLGNETSNQSNYFNWTYQPGVFDAQVVIMSNVQIASDYTKHLFALPGQTSANIYRDFSIFIFVNQPAHYLLKIDNFTIENGNIDWLKRIDRHSDYSTADIYILVENMSGGSREFTFSKLKLIDSPWQAGGSGTGEQTSNQIPEIIKPYIEMSQGEYSLYVAKRVAADIISVIAGILVGIQFAALRADFRGIERAL